MLLKLKETMVAEAKVSETSRFIKPKWFMFCADWAWTWTLASKVKSDF